MALSDYFPRGEFVKNGFSPVVVDYLAKLAKQVKILSDLEQAQVDIVALQTALAAAQALIVVLEAEIAEVPLQERPGVGLAFAIATSASPTPWSASVIPTENCAAGAFTNIYSSAGVARVRRADATDSTKPANSFVLAALTSGVAGTVTLSGLNTAVTVATAAAQTWLSDTTPGGYLTTAPTTAGHVDQEIGEAIPGVGILFSPKLSILL